MSPRRLGGRKALKGTLGIELHIDESWDGLGAYPCGLASITNRTRRIRRAPILHCGIHVGFKSLIYLKVSSNPFIRNVSSCQGKAQLAPLSVTPL